MRESCSVPVRIPFENMSDEGLSRRHIECLFWLLVSEGMPIWNEKTKPRKSERERARMEIDLGGTWAVSSVHNRELLQFTPNNENMVEDS